MRKEHEKQSEFYLNESVMNFETVKSFNNEPLEEQRYTRHVDKLKQSAIVVADSLAKLNYGQNIIFSAGLSINLALAAWDVSTGYLTPGDFVMI